LATIALACLITTVGWAQAPDAPQPQAPQPQAAPPQQFQLLQDYSKPRSHFPDPLAPYMPRHVPPANLQNTPRIDQLLHNGKLMLSMDDAVALALENNLDLVIARYTLNIADTDLLRAKAGASILGTPLGIVQNTPGGSPGGLGGQIGSGAGGTNPGTGGVGAGSGGITFNTEGIGSNITSFDPILTGTLQFDHNNSLSTSSFSAPITAQNTQVENFGYAQGFPSGTNLSVQFNNSRAVTNNPFISISPSLTPNFRFQVSQQLLQGFGFAPNTRYIQIAKNNREESDVVFRLQVITTVDQIENMYWNLVFQYENVRVQKESLAFAQKTLSDTKKQVDIGSLAPIEVVRAQSTVSTDQQALTVAETNLQLAQLLLKNALSRSLQDSTLAGAEVIPTSTMQLPAQEAVAPIADLVNDALSHRADLAQLRIDLANRQISIKSVRNAMLPTLNLFAYYQGSGLGGAQNPANLCVNQPLQAQQTGFCSGPNPANGNTVGIPTVSSIGYQDSLNQLVNSTAPDKGIGLTLNIPLRNRVGEATQVRSELEYRQAEVHLQQFENQVRIEVRQAQFTLQQNRAAVEAAQAAVELERQSLDAEQKKYGLGASTTTLVLQQQSSLATSESNLLSAMALYEKSQVDLDRATGLLLDHAGIDIADALRGQVSHLPTVPYVTANPEASPPAPAR
jgi:outer membrane protein TolC